VERSTGVQIAIGRGLPQADQAANHAVRSETAGLFVLEPAGLGVGLVHRSPRRVAM
jgi:hypothetical protein